MFGGVKSVETHPTNEERFEDCILSITAKLSLNGAELEDPEVNVPDQCIVLDKHFLLYLMTH